MSVIKFNLSLIIILILVQNTREFRFMRRIKAIGRPYYRIQMALGACKERVLFFDQKLWQRIALNRILDIYYKSDNELYKVSRVEIDLIINNTSSFACSEAGVGNSEFSATLYLPTNLNYVIYALTIFTCDRDRDSIELSLESRGHMPHIYMPFLRNDKSEY